jgi:lycopene beta-cyclase
MEHYDYILTGGGAAGLSLAMKLVNQTGFDKRILIIDRDKKTSNDRTWCFWSADQNPYPDITFRTWDKLNFQGIGFKKTYDIQPYRYYMIRAVDFYEHARQILTGKPEVTFIQSTVNKVEDGKSFVVVSVDGNEYSADWVFDSLFDPNNFIPQPDRYHYLNQHFRGWEIETEFDAFDPQCPTLFDFRTPQNGCMRFIYILPFSTRQAMVEYTLFSEELLSPQAYDQGLHDYIEKVMQIREYKIHMVENGVIPMTDHPFPRRLGRRILAIGTKGGRVKPSTGYAFLRIQNDSKSIVNSIKNFGHPYNIPKGPTRYQLFDSIMLQVMKRNGWRMSSIFTDLFRKNPIHSIFKFLDEENPLFADLKILASLPFPPFVSALIRLKLLKKL